MSQSPLDPSRIDEANDPERPYRKAILEVGAILDRGGSLSGNERNCAFLNTGGGRFATVSAVTGLDFPDDARAVAFTDWDGDGDLDLWTTTRTSPLLRFVQNQLPPGSGWVAFRLEGTRGNRDAIGARVRVRLRDGRTLARSLRSGDGFLTGGSKTLHFGLGEGAAIRGVTVDWPGGAREEIGGVEAGHRYVLTERTPTASRVPARAPVTLAPGPLRPGPTEDRYHARTGSLRTIPRIPFESFGGAPQNTQPASEKPFLLVNLWAAWCVPCLAELRDLAGAADELRAGGIDVLALSTDELDTRGRTTRSDARALLDELAFPFSAAVATDATIALLGNVHRHQFGVDLEFPVPTSVLLTGDGRVAAWYFGPADPATLLADAAAARLPGPGAYPDAALPFPGRWFERPGPLSTLGFGVELMAAGEVDAASDFVTRAGAQLDRDDETAKLLVWIGDQLSEDGGPAATAMGHYARALELDPDNLIVLNNLAWQLATHGDPAVRDPATAVSHARKAATLTNFQNASVLDTLATAYEAAGMPSEAAETRRRMAALER